MQAPSSSTRVGTGSRSARSPSSTPLLVLVLLAAAVLATQGARTRSAAVPEVTAAAPALVDPLSTLFRHWTRCLTDSPWLDRAARALPTSPLPREELRAHYAELTNATRGYRALPAHAYAKYKGPWIENHWIREFCCDQPLDAFGGLVPIFVQWVDLFVRHPTSYRDEVERVLAMLRADVLYVTVSQSDEGIYPRGGDGLEARAVNVLVLSAGGYGHVPLPLIKGELARAADAGRDDAVAGYPHFMGFAGSAHRMRRRWIEEDLPRARAALRDAVGQVANGTAVAQGGDVATYHGPDWRRFMSDTLLNLAPRGFGRSSFRLAESVQLGRLPVYLYDDVAWVPYRGSRACVAASIGFSVRFDEFVAWCNGTLARALRAQDLSSLRGKLARLRAARDSHYTYAGVVREVRRFLQDPLSSDLRCEAHPAHPTGWDESAGAPLVRALL